MTFFARILGLLFWILVLCWGIVLVRRFIAWLMRGAGEPRQSVGPGNNPSAQSHRLVRDPVCGTHVAEELAVPLKEGNTVTYFCSENCREDYLAQTRRKAAGG